MSDFEVNLNELARHPAALGAAGAALADDLTMTVPDTGASTGATASALARVLAAARGLADDLDGLGSDLDACLGSYAATDGAGAGLLQDLATAAVLVR